MRTLLIAGAAALLGGCGRSSDNAATNQVAANTLQPKKATYCFFKDAETKGWTASRGKDGSIIVKGKAYREDSRYKAVLGPPEIAGASVSISPTITTNDSYATADGWWDVAATIPNSAAIDRVTVTCGAKTLADLKVATKA